MLLPVKPHTLDSTKNLGMGDSPTCCFWTQLFLVICLDPAVGFYPLLLHILWKYHQLVDYLHWWRWQIAPSYWNGRFWIRPKIEEQEILLPAAFGHNFSGSVVLILRSDFIRCRCSFSWKSTSWSISCIGGIRKYLLHVEPDAFGFNW